MRERKKKTRKKKKRKKKKRTKKRNGDGRASLASLTFFLARAPKVNVDEGKTGYQLPNARAHACNHFILFSSQS